MQMSIYAPQVATLYDGGVVVGLKVNESRISFKSYTAQSCYGLWSCTETICNIQRESNMVAVKLHLDAQCNITQSQAINLMNSDNIFQLKLALSILMIIFILIFIIHYCLHIPSFYNDTEQEPLLLTDSFSKLKTIHTITTFIALIFWITLCALAITLHYLYLKQINKIMDDKPPTYSWDPMVGFNIYSIIVLIFLLLGGSSLLFF